MATILNNRRDPGDTFSVLKSHPFPCNTCHVVFRNSDLQKEHMRGDWHRYNLGRRVASLPPISAETFSIKVLQSRAETSAQAEKAGFEQTCETCRKTYYSDNSYRNHLGSAKHKAKAAAGSAPHNAGVADDASSMTFSLGDPAPTNQTIVDSDAEDEFNEVVEGLKSTSLGDRKSPVRRPSNPHLSAAAQHKEEHPVSPSPDAQQSDDAAPSSATPTTTKPAGPSYNPKTCIVCNYESPTPPLNANHMEKIHGLFIPEKKYLVDLEGLIGALQERVFELNECLQCGKLKANAYAVQTHMRDTGHCHIPYTTEEEQLEIGEFYDFRSTYSDGDEWEDESDQEGEPEPGGGAKLGAKRTAKVTADGDDEVMEDGDWETDSDASSLDSDDLHAVPADQHYHQYERLSKHPHHSRDTARPHHQADGWHAHSHKRPHAVFYDDYEMHLPSGKSVGHRSLNRYFRQNLYSYPTPEERAERLAIEAAEAESAMDMDDDESKKVASAARGRALVTRDMRALGITGAMDPRAREVTKITEKGNLREWASQARRRDMKTVAQFKEKSAHPATYLR